MLQLTVFLLGLSGLAAGWFTYHSRVRLIDDAAADLAHLSRVVAGQLSERIHLLDHIIEQSGEAYRARAELGQPNQAEMDDLLAAQVADIGPAIRVLGIVTADGVTQYSSRGLAAKRPYTGDRGYFREHRDAGRRVLLSGPVLSRADGKPALYISRRIDDRHGRFLGVAFANIDPTVFDRDLARMGLPEGAVATLLTPDGGVVAGCPPATTPAALTQGDDPSFAIPGAVNPTPLHPAGTPPTAPTGVPMGVPIGVPAGGVPAGGQSAAAAELHGAQLTYRTRLAGLPLSLTVAVPESAYLGLWYGDIRSIAAITAMIAVCLLLVMAGLHRQLRINDAHAAALDHTRDLLEAAQSLAQLGNWLWDAGRRSVEVSQQFVEMLAIAPGATTRPGEVWRAILPPDRPLLRQAWRTLVRGGPTQRLELRVVRPDGEVRNVAVVAQRDTARTGPRAGIFGTVLDITQRKRAEAERRRWADAFENAAFGIAITDATRNTQLTVNPAYAALHGMTVNELTDFDVARLHPPEAIRTHLQAMRSADATGHVEFDTDRIRKDGARFPVRISLTTVPDEAGRPLYRIATVSDITERKSIEQQLVQAQKMEAIGNLTGGIAHDFNNLLAIIVVSLDSLEPLVRDDEDAATLVADCLAAALSGASLTQRLLAFARRQALAPGIVSINHLVDGMVALLRRSLGETIVVSLQLDTALWPTFVDPGQLQASLLNLAMNARDAMPKGGHLQIATANKRIDADAAQTHPELQPGDYVTITVSDTGVGMAAEVMEHIFEPFYTTKERGRGTGLGLSMVFGFLRQSNGLITVYSAPGKGATFRLYLPRSVRQPAATARPDQAPPTAGGSETILVVEDNEKLRQTVVRQLVSLNYDVVSAADADDALTLLQNRRVDVLLTDVVMPGSSDGFALAREVTARWPATRIVFTSGFAETKLNGNAASPTPPVRILTKPYRRDELARMIRDTLDG